MYTYPTDSSFRCSVEDLARMLLYNASIHHRIIIQELSVHSVTIRKRHDAVAFHASLVELTLVPSTIMKEQGAEPMLSTEGKLSLILGSSWENSHANSMWTTV